MYACVICTYVPLTAAVRIPSYIPTCVEVCVVDINIWFVVILVPFGVQLGRHFGCSNIFTRHPASCPYCLCVTFLCILGIEEQVHVYGYKVGKCIALSAN